MLVGGGVMGLLFLAGQWFTVSGALGLGDVWLGVSLGALLGPLGVARALAWGMILLGVVAVALLATRRITLKSYLPLGTCLIAGALLSAWLVPPFWL
jgi:leader peptidase (prepilin peptidase) / N-methyltransferase